MAKGASAGNLENAPGQALRQAGMLAMLGGFLILLSAVSGFIGWRLPLALEAAPFFLCTTLVALTLTMPPSRGRTPVIACGMVGSILGLTSAFGEAVLGTPGRFMTLAYIAAFAGAALYGLSYRKPRHEVPRWAIYAGLSGAAFLILDGLLADAGRPWSILPVIVPAATWLTLGKTAILTESMPAQAAPAGRGRPKGRR